METIHADHYLEALADRGYAVGRTIGNMPDPLTEDLLARLVLTALAGTTNPDIGRLVADRGAMPTLKLLLDATSEDLTAADILPGSVAAMAQPIAVEHGRGLAGRIASALEEAGAGRFELMVPGHEYWPDRLADLGSNQPLVLWAQGNLEPLRDWRSTTVVGARAATGYGEHVAMELAADLAARSQVIVNGGSYGIEGMALRASLADGGSQIVVMGGGVARRSPAGHDALFQRVEENGVVVSESMPDAPPTRWGFQQANRIKAALSHSTIVVEAGARSGALDVARRAQLLDRFVGAIPGPTTSAASRGCHELIQTGTARLVTQAADIPIVASDPSVGPMTREPVVRHHDAPHEAAPSPESASRSL